MKRSHLKWVKRIGLWILILFAVLLLVTNLILPFGFGIFATWDRDSSVGDPPDGFEEVTLTTSDEVKLAAWYAPPQNGAVIIVVHGSGNSREDVRKHSTLLAEHGFGVLALDMRGHGESDGGTNRFGWMGTQDVGAAVDYLAQQADVKNIGALGLSLGGEVVLGSASAYPAIKAIVSEGATYRFVDEYTALDANNSFLHSFPTRVLTFSVGLFSGEDTPTPIMESLKAATDTHFLFIAAGKLDEESDYGNVFVDAVGDRGELWVVPESDHIQGLKRAPDEYEQKVVGFFETNLISQD